jgi:hypothetical protein
MVLCSNGVGGGGSGGDVGGLHVAGVLELSCKWIV